MNFNLLSVVQSDLLLCKLDEDFVGNVEMSIQKTTSEKYIGSYIINQEPVVARINFVRFDALEPLLTSFDEMHDFNVKYFKDQINEYYANPFKSEEAAEVFKEDFERRVMHWIRNALPKGQDKEDFKKLSFWPRSDGEELRIGLHVWEDESVDIANTHQKANEKVRKALADIYRYNGPFTFVADLPF